MCMAAENLFARSDSRTQLGFDSLAAAGMPSVPSICYKTHASACQSDHLQARRIFRDHGHQALVHVRCCRCAHMRA